MGRFTVIPQDTFNGLQLDAGVLLKTFNPANPVAPNDSDIICATTGGINVVCKANFSDLGEDVDNVPNNMMELKHLDSWDCSISTTSLGTTPELIQFSLGCADVDSSGTAKITPRADLQQTDFSDLWWVGDRADGGMVAIQIKNALSTEGFSLQTTKNGKGQISITITGHVSINDQQTVPMVFYSTGPNGSITLSSHHITIEEGATATLTANVMPSNSVVTWASTDTGNATVAASGASPYHTATVSGKADGAGTATITATITYSGNDYTDTCVVTVVDAS